MNYIDTLKKSSNKFNSITCFGMDPVLDNMPGKGSQYKIICNFYESIINKMIQHNVFPGAVKPNYAFYARYGLPGIKALAKLIPLAQSVDLPVILDVKRGDIGTTAVAYADEAFTFFQADAVTLSPYMGYDSIKPFMTAFPEKGYYILTKTSNTSSSDFQELVSDGLTVYEHVANKIIEWYKPGIGSVVGATFPEQLYKINKIFISSGKDIPLLIPGVGSQGGNLVEILKVLSQSGDISHHRINSSSALNYAYLKNPGTHFAEAAVKALHKLNDEISEIINGIK